MLPLDVCFLVFMASLALAVAPGPDIIFVLTQSAIFGWRAGVVITFGLMSGLFFHVSIVALGVAAIFRTSEMAFNALKIAGGIYLLYLAWKSFCAGKIAINPAEKNAVSRGALYFRGVIMNVTNPKVALFFLAFLPQFAEPERGSVPLQITLLGLIFLLAALPVFIAVSYAAGAIGDWLRKNGRAQIFINRAAGVIFLFLACRLIFF